MVFDTLNQGFTPRRHPFDAVLLGLVSAGLALVAQTLAQTLLAPTPDGLQTVSIGNPGSLIEAVLVGLHSHLRLSAVLATGAVAGVVAFGWHGAIRR